MSVLVFSPHPDDEAIGCGGAILAHAKAGDAVHVVFLTSGEKGGHGSPEAETAARRETEAQGAAGILGVASVAFWRFPDGGLAATRDLVTRIADCLAATDPATVYFPYDRDAHPDHRAAARAFKAAAGSIGARARFLMYEVWTPVPQVDEIVDISASLGAKLEAIRAHASQCAVLRFDEAAEGLARWRGEMFSWPKDRDPPKGRHAEVFQRWQPEG